MEETAACTGFANANDRSRVTRVGLAFPKRAESLVVSGVSARGGSLAGCDDLVEAGWNRQVVIKVLNSGVEDDALAFIRMSVPYKRTRPNFIPRRFRTVDM